MKTLCAAFILALVAVSVSAAPAKKAAKQASQWTLNDTVTSALNYSPAVKARLEAVNAAREGVNQAKAGRLPKVNAAGQTGFGSLPVSKYD